MKCGERKGMGLMRLMGRMGLMRDRVVRHREVSDGELLEGLAVDVEHPVLRAVIEVLERAQEQGMDAAADCVGDDRKVAFYLGGRAALQEVEGYLLELRREGVRRVKES